MAGPLQSPATGKGGSGTLIGTLPVFPPEQPQGQWIATPRGYILRAAGVVAPDGAGLLGASTLGVQVLPIGTAKPAAPLQQPASPYPFAKSPATPGPPRAEAKPSGPIFDPGARRSSRRGSVLILRALAAPPTGPIVPPEPPGVVNAARVAALNAQLESYRRLILYLRSRVSKVYQATAGVRGVSDQLATDALKRINQLEDTRSALVYERYRQLALMEQIKRGGPQTPDQARYNAAASVRFAQAAAAVGADEAARLAMKGRMLAQDQLPLLQRRTYPGASRPAAPNLALPPLLQFPLQSKAQTVRTLLELIGQNQQGNAAARTLEEEASNAISTLGQAGLRSLLASGTLTPLQTAHAQNRLHRLQQTPTPGQARTQLLIPGQRRPGQAMTAPDSVGGSSMFVTPSTPGGGLPTAGAAAGLTQNPVAAGVVSTATVIQGLLVVRQQAGEAPASPVPPFPKLGAVPPPGSPGVVALPDFIKPSGSTPSDP